MYVDQIYDLNETRNTLHTSSTSKSSNRRFSYSLNIIVAMDCSMTIFCSTTSNTISFIMIKDNMIIDGFFNNRFVDDNRFIIDRFINWIFFKDDSFIINGSRFVDIIDSLLMGSLIGSSSPMIIGSLLSGSPGC